MLGQDNPEAKKHHARQTLQARQFHASQTIVTQGK